LEPQVRATVELFRGELERLWKGEEKNWEPMKEVLARKEGEEGGGEAVHYEAVREQVDAPAAAGELAVPRGAKFGARAREFVRSG
jgi:hypothetical protein